jgi:hypothetical protein
MEQLAIMLDLSANQLHDFVLLLLSVFTVAQIVPR